MGGDVEVHMVGGTSGDRHVDLSSMGGDIILTVPAGLSMDIDIEIRVSDRANYDDYRIESDFDLEFGNESQNRQTYDGHRYIVANGSVLGGENRIKIRTINGDVFLRRSR